MMDESYGRDFEYDEGVESGDEGVEMDESESDESFATEAEDLETDEDIEMEMEMESDESDEAYAVPEDIGEDIEAESDIEAEAEAFDEAAVSASARLRADQDRRRRASWARRIAADQRLEARRAASTQRSITTQVKSIQKGVGGPTRIASVGSLQGAGVVTAVLPNGRRSRMRIIPTVAPISEVNRLRNVVMVNEKRQAMATGKNARSIAKLASAQAAAVKRLTDQQLKSDKDLAKRIVEGDNRLDARIAKELSGGAGVLGKHGKQMARMLKRQRQRALWNNILLASSAPFFAAYGERSDPFAKNNLILTGSLLGWLVADDVADALSGKSKAVKSGANLFSYLAPVGNGATAYFLLRNKQHERFITGLTTVPASGTIDVSVGSSRVGKGALEAFKTDKHAIVATAVDSTAVANADVRAELIADGKLRLTVTPAAATKVAWIIDTRKTEDLNA